MEPNNSISKRQQRSAARRHRERIQTILIVSGGILVLVSLFLLLWKPGSQASAGPARIGSPLGDFVLTDLNGNNVHLGDYSGKVVLVNTWATWCPPCRAEMPTLNQYYQEHINDGFMILAVNAGDSKSEASSFANSLGLSFPVLLDLDSSLVDTMAIHSFPTSILVGRDGVVKTIHVGLFTPEALEQEITPYLSQ